MTEQSRTLWVIVLSVIVAHIAHNEGSDVPVGPNPVRRQLQDGGTNATFGAFIPQPRLVLPEGGVLTTWSVYFTGTQGKVRLQVWRPTRESIKAGPDYNWFHRLIAQTEFHDVTIEGGGAHEYELWPKRKIRLFPNDTIGFQWVSANPVPFDISMRGCSNLAATRVFDETFPDERFASNQYYKFKTLMNGPTAPECRMYSVQAMLDTKECTTLVASRSSQVHPIFYNQRAHVDDCWVIKPSDPDANLRISLFQELTTQQSSASYNACVVDMLEVRHDLPTRTVFVEYSGCKLGRDGLTFDSFRTPFYIRLTTSPNVTYPETLSLSLGYLSYDRRTVNHTCTRTDAGLVPTYIESPGFPIAYPSNLDRCWVVRAPAGSRVRVELEDSELEPQGVTCRDYVEIFDGASESGNLLSKWCGREIPDVITSSGPDMFIHFVTDHIGGYPGFRLAVFSTTNDSSTTCTRLLASGEEKFLYSTGYPHLYPDNSDACWVIEASPGYRVLLRVYDSRLEGATEACPYDAVELKDGNTSSSALLRRWCGRTYPEGDILTSGRSAFIHFASDDSISGAGFYLSFIEVLTDACTTLVAFPFPRQVSPSPPFEGNSTLCWLIQMPTKETKIRLRNAGAWKVSNCALHYVQIYDGDTVLDPVLGRWCGKEDEEPVISTGDVMLIRVVMQRPLATIPFTLEYVAVVDGNCHRITVGHSHDATAWISAPINESPVTTDSTARGPITQRPPGGTLGNQPSRTVKYGSNLDVCTVVEATFGKDTFFNITFIFTEIEDPNSTGVCANDFLEIRDGESKDAPLLKVVCGSRPPFHFRTSGRFAFFRFVSNDVNEYRGYQVKLTVNRTSEFGQCETLEAKAVDSKLISPGYPRNYSSNMDICWVLKAASRGSRIKLMLAEYSTGSTCADFLQIFDGTSGNAPLLGYVCGDKRPTEITSSGPYVYVRFVSDGSLQDRGFKIIYRTMASDACVHVPAARWQKYIQSPRYPKPYLPGQDLCWIVTTANADHGVALAVSRTDVEYSKQCDADFIEVRDGPSSTSPLIRRWCGMDSPETMTSSGRSIYIRFVSDDKNKTKSGFKMAAQLVERPVPWQRNTKLFLGLIISICLVALAIIIATIVCICLRCCFCCCCKKRKRQSTRTAVPEAPVNHVTYVVPQVFNGQMAAPPYTEIAVGAQAPPLETKEILFDSDETVTASSNQAESEEGAASSEETADSPGYTRLP